VISHLSRQRKPAADVKHEILLLIMHLGLSRRTVKPLDAL
jgi:hypothetical protein